MRALLPARHRCHPRELRIARRYAAGLPDRGISSPDGRAARCHVARGSAGRVSLRVLAVDHERPALDGLARILRAQPSITAVDTAESDQEALHALAGEHYDAVFLGVRAPRLGGIGLARLLRRFASPPALIFVSGCASAAVEAFELRALDYLIEPVSRTRIAEALARVQEK